jgi:Predicted transcriptional regulators
LGSAEELVKEQAPLDSGHRSRPDADGDSREVDVIAARVGTAPVALPEALVRGSRTGRPPMALLDLLGRRWALRVIWELRTDGVGTFRELQDRCGNVSSSVLNKRLRELRTASVVCYGEDGGYKLTPDGEQLLLALGPLEAWAEAWAARLETARAVSDSSRPPVV